MWLEWLDAEEKETKKLALENTRVHIYLILLFLTVASSPQTFVVAFPSAALHIYMVSQ